MYAPEPGHVISTWVLPLVPDGSDGRPARILIRWVYEDSESAGWLRLSGTELDRRNRPIGSIDALADLDRMSRISTGAVDIEPVLYTGRFYADAALHRPRRPEWTCRQCGQNWPCVNARLLIKHHLRDDYPAVAATMTALLTLADADIDRCDRQKLYQDFTAWTRRDEVCGICGSAQHVARPGVPPRLIRCDGLRTWMAGEQDPARAVGER